MEMEEKMTQIFTRWADDLTIVYFSGYNEKQMKKNAQGLGMLLFTSEARHVSAERYMLDSGITAYLLWGLTKPELEKLKKFTGCTETTAVEGLEDQGFLANLHDPEEEKGKSEKVAETSGKAETEAKPDELVPEQNKAAEPEKQDRKEAEVEASNKTEDFGMNPLEEEEAVEDKKEEMEAEKPRQRTFMSICTEWKETETDHEALLKEALSSIEKYEKEKKVKAVYAASTTIFRNTSEALYRRKNGENAKPSDKELAAYVAGFLKKNGEKGVQFFIKEARR